MIHQHRLFMKEILSQILFLSLMSLMDFFSTVAQKVQSKIKFSSKLFLYFLPTNIHESIILSQIIEDEIFKIISSLNSSNSTCPNTIPTKILKLLQVQISKHLTDIFNLSFITGIFPHSLKSAKVIPIHIKKIKTDCV